MICVDWYDSRCFKIYSYKTFGAEESKNVILDCIGVYLKKDSSYAQRLAADILLKFYLTNKFYSCVIKELHSMLVGEVSDRNDPKVKAWKNMILSKGQCEICGSKYNLEAHHIEPWSLCPEKRIDPNNGLCLCHDCHTKEHEFDPSYYMMKAGRKGANSCH